MSRKSLLLALPLALALGACVQVHASRLGEGTHYEPVPRGQVRVYQAESDVPGEFEKVALLFVSADADVIDHHDMIEAARKKAGRLGANAIVLGEFEDPKFTTRVAAAVLNVPAERRTQMLAIRVLRPGETPSGQEPQEIELEL